MRYRRPTSWFKHAALTRHSRHSRSASAGFSQSATGGGSWHARSALLGRPRLRLSAARSSRAGCAPTARSTIRAPSQRFESRSPAPNTPLRPMPGSAARPSNRKSSARSGTRSVPVPRTPHRHWTNCARATSSPRLRCRAGTPLSDALRTRLPAAVLQMKSALRGYFNGWTRISKRRRSTSFRRSTS